MTLPRLHQSQLLLDFCSGARHEVVDILGCARRRQILLQCPNILSALTFNNLYGHTHTPWPVLAHAPADHVAGTRHSERWLRDNLETRRARQLAGEILCHALGERIEFGRVRVIGKRQYRDGLLRSRRAGCRSDRRRLRMNTLRKQMQNSLREGGRKFAGREIGPLNCAELLWNSRVLVFCAIDDHGHKKRLVIGHVIRACDGELPLAPKITFESSLSVGRYDRNKERAISDLAADLLVPSIAAPKLALIEPHLDAG